MKNKNLYIKRRNKKSPQVFVLGGISFSVSLKFELYFLSKINMMDLSALRYNLWLKLKKYVYTRYDTNTSLTSIAAVVIWDYFSCVSFRGHAIFLIVHTRSYYRDSLRISRKTWHSALVERSRNILSLSYSRGFSRVRTLKKVRTWFYRKILKIFLF